MATRIDDSSRSFRRCASAGVTSAALLPLSTNQRVGLP